MATGSFPLQTVDDVYLLVRMAVLAKRQVGAVYDSQKRWLCPHKLGWNARKRPRVLCYQFAGESVTGLEPPGSPDNWRCLAVEKLSGVELVEGAWYSAPNYSRPQTCMIAVDVDAEDIPQ
jgi:hypothetical protein